MAVSLWFDGIARQTLVASMLAAAACTPALNWREVRPEGFGLTALFPCRPSVYARKLVLAAAQVELVLQACTADGQTWALASAELRDPLQIAPALDELFTAASKNIAASSVAATPLAVAGATPNLASRRAALRGHLPNGQAVNEQVAVFARGTRVFQATVVGAELPANLHADSAEIFFAGLRFTP